MIKDDNNIRTGKYKKNELIEKILYETNIHLEKVEFDFIKDYTKPKLPVIFIVGVQRSGTTLLNQLIVNFFKVSYPNNFIARFWNTPFLGAVLYKSLEKNIIEDNIQLASDLGHTKGLTGPHEFGYFWRKWFPWESWEEKKYEEINYSVFQKQLAAWENLNNSPLIFKNIANVIFHMEKINELLSDTFFIYIKRKPEYVIQSTYISRLKLFGTDKEWFGIKPPQYPQLTSLPPIEQICRQVYYVEKFLDEIMANQKNVFFLKYEELVNEPQKHLAAIKNFAKLENKKELNIDKLENTNKIKVEKTIFSEIEKNVKNLF